MPFTLQLENVQSALEVFEHALEGPNLPAVAVADITADVQTIKAQLSKRSPSMLIVKEAGESIRQIVEAIDPEILTPAAVSAAAGLWTALGLE